MKRNLHAAALGAFLLVGGCASQSVDTSKLSYEAKTMLLQAEYDIKAADQKNVNTVAAYEELDAAEAAARTGDDASVVKHADAADAAALQAIKKGK
jgi:hypothetical protein